jgi:hypothetical protein
MVALLVYLLLAAILTFGHALYVAQGLQQAADFAAREIARTPLPADATFEEVLTDGSLGPDGANIYSEDYLVFDLYDLEENQSFFQDIVQDWPLLNQQLATLMIVDNSIPGRRLLRYPGALLNSETSPTGFTVGVPLIVSREGAHGEEVNIQWIPIVEEIEAADPNDPRHNPFQISSDQRGIVALRINYPFQSASMSSFRANRNEPFAATIGAPNAADDGAVTELNPGDRPGGFVAGPVDGSQGFHAGTYGGQYGLGAQGAFGRVDEITGGRPVRPYRRVISAQAIYRREIFE